ncbi:unnamed protein product [Rhizoctonia solani]|uniref:MARVEL domain-containing protein n=1 Tax=Rhizoctonia solani TaxID=456999 RepID=A0A8H3BMW8_9AGAM|nr:unnamed protein product [Rhizoctonia solani]
MFKEFRLGLFVIVFAAASVVLGICSYLTDRLISTPLHDFLIFSVVVSALTIVVLLLLAQRSQPRVDAIVLFILAGLWLTMGAYSQDVIGHQFCYGLRGQTIPAKNDTTSAYLDFVAYSVPNSTRSVSAEGYCRRMKTVLAFSWAIFVFLTIGLLRLLTLVNKIYERGNLTIGLLRLLTLVNKIYERGNRDIWRGSISDITYFEESPVNKSGEYPREYPRDYPRYPPSSPPPLPNTPGQTHVYYPANSTRSLQSQVIQQQPGHSVIIRDGRVTQVPGSVVSA